MGNSLGSKKTAKVMRINGETFKIKAPVEAGEVLKDYPGLVLLESEAVKHYGVRAKPLASKHELKPKRLYFLVELPKIDKVPPRRVRSGINMSAKDRLESLMLSRRSVSDLSIMKPMSLLPAEDSAESSPSAAAPVRVRMRLPKVEVEKLMKESKDEAEVAEKIVDLCLVKSGGGGKSSTNNDITSHINVNHDNVDVNGSHWKGSTTAGHGRGGVGQSIKATQKRVSFCPINEGEIQIAVA